MPAIDRETYGSRTRVQKNAVPISATFWFERLSHFRSSNLTIFTQVHMCSQGYLSMSFLLSDSTQGSNLWNIRAGVMEDGRRVAATKGSPQGAVISPALANIYLHYVLDLWARQ